MSCPEFREEIELTVGSADVSPALNAHLQTCVNCRSYFEELTTLTSLVSDESPFGLSPLESQRLLAGIESGTVPVHKTEIISLRWARFAGVAAVVMLSFIGVTGYMRGWFGDSKVGLDTLTTVSRGPDTSSVVDSASSATTLIDEYLSGAVSSGDELFLSSSGTVLDSLSEDEVKYLETHFDAKDVL